jgi:hypothetical protein
MYGYFGEGKNWEHEHYGKLAARDALDITRHGIKHDMEPGQYRLWKVMYYDFVKNYDAAAYWYYNA